MKEFAGYALGTITHPQVTLREVSQEKSLRQGLSAILLISILYSISWMIAACIIATHEARRIPLGRAAITTVVSLLPMAFILGITIR